MSQFRFILQFILCTRQFHHKLEVGKRHLHLLLPSFHMIYLDEFLQNQCQLFLGNSSRLMQTVHIIEIAFVEIGGRNALHGCITGSASDLLHVIDKRTRRSHMVDTVDITDVHPHTKSLGSYDQPLTTILKGVYNGSLLHLVLLPVVGSDQRPVGRLHPRLDPHVDPTGKGIIEQRLMPVQIVVHTGRNGTLLGLVVSFPFLQLQLADVKTNIPTLHRTNIEHTGFHLQRTDRLENHIVVARRIPYCRSRQGKQREVITQCLFQAGKITPQEPIVYAELLTPGSHRMSLIDYDKPNTTVAHKVMDVVGQQQLGREVEQVHLTLAHPAIYLSFLFGRQVGRSVCHTLVTQILQSLYLIDNQSLQRGNDERKQSVCLPQINAGQLKKQRLARSCRSRQQDIVRPLTIVFSLFGFPNDVFD